MRYNYDYGNCKFAKGYSGRLYVASNPLYETCTLYQNGDIGLAVIQQRYDSSTKSTYWGQIDLWLVDDIYCNPKFADVFISFAKPALNGQYPTISLRKLMWRLRMKPLPRQSWETDFNRFVL